MLIGEYDKSVILTYLGATFSLLAIWLVWQNQLTYAMMAFIISGVCDLFDGVVARKMKRTPAQAAFGIEIDSLCDMISFAALPAVLLLSRGALGQFNLVLAILYVLAAVTRLAHFNRLAKGEEGTPTHFIGVPVTYGALVFPFSYLICQWLLASALPFIWSTLALLMTFLFVWNRPIPKPNKVAYIFFILLAIGTLVGLGLL